MIGPNASSVAIEVKGPGSYTERQESFLSCLASYCTMSSNKKVPSGALFFFCYTKKEAAETTTVVTKEAVAVTPEQTTARQSGQPAERCRNSRGRKPKRSRGVQAAG